MPVSYSFATLFSGGGGTDIGLMAAGLTHAWSVEWDPAIAEVHRQNIDGTILIADVGAVDYRAVAPVDFLHASPSCINASQAKADAGEQPEDIHSAEAVVRALEAIGPRWFSLENVTMYRTFQSFRLITDALARAGYRMAVEHVNCADLGIPQTRRRLILRATKDRSIRGIRRTHCRAAKVSADLSLFGDDLLPWNGWYAAIEDLIPTLPETQFAPWQLQRLQNMPEGTFLHMTRNTQMENPTGTGIKMPFDPAGTVCASESQSARAFLIDGKATGEDYGPAPRVGTLPANTVTTYDRPSNVPKGLLVSNAKTEFGDGTRNSESPAFAVTTQHDGRLRALLVSRQTAGAGSPGAQRSCAPEPAHTVTHHPAGQTRAFLVDCQDSGSEVGLTIRDAADPTFTVSATMFPHRPARPSLACGRVVSMTPRCLARFQSFPDTYQLPDDRRLACKVIGNALPPLLATRIAESLVPPG